MLYIETFLLMKKHLFLFATLMCLVFVSCSSGGGDDEPTPNPQPTPKPETPTITLDSSISSSGVNFSDGKDEKSISFTTSTDWTLSIAEVRSGTSWCIPSATSGPKGNATVKFTVTENTEYDDRSVSVTIKAGTASKSFKITQKGVDALLVTKKEYEAEAKGGTIQVSFESNVEVTVTADCDWIKVNTTSARSLATTTITMEISENTTTDKRTGHVTISNGTLSEMLTVTQKGKDPTNGSIENFEEENQEW